MSEENSGLEQRVKEVSHLFHSAIAEISNEIIGYKDIIQKLLVCLLSEGHVLLEGVPGIAKTKIVVSLARLLGLSHKRVQCTPDLLPADITGLTLFRPDTGRFEVHKGPIFTNILIADEVNRTPPKVQSSLLEAMAEKQVTIFGNTDQLPRPFFVMATQNPIEQEGTYPLPEAQLDRFMFKLIMKPLGVEEEKRIIQCAIEEEKERDKKTSILSQADVAEAIFLTSKVFIDQSIIDYIARIVLSTRDEELQKKCSVFPSIRLGASPRASIAIAKGARAMALLQGRSFVTPYDVKEIALDILRHRIVVSFDAEAKGVTVDDVVRSILTHTNAP